MVTPAKEISSQTIMGNNLPPVVDGGHVGSKTAAEDTFLVAQNTPPVAHVPKSNAACNGQKLQAAAESYVRLALRFGQYDSDYVDAYYGPEELKPEGKPAAEFPIEEFRKEAAALVARLEAIRFCAYDKMERLRHEHLVSRLVSLQARIEMTGRKKFTFDEESRLLFGAVAPARDDRYFEDILNKLASELPGEGSIEERYNRFRKGFLVPEDKLKEVLEKAIDECRRRTREHISLPDSETFKLQLVSEKPWRAYNWYKGNLESLIEYNTSTPTYIDSMIDIAAHEGYPGHHVQNSLLEKDLTRGRGWVEFSIVPLFSPQIFLFEGAADYGIDVVFPHEERVKFEEKELFPLVGIDKSKARKYYEIMKLKKGLDAAKAEAARRYLEGRVGKEETMRWMEKYALLPHEDTERYIRFIEKYRSYVINYSEGEEFVRGLIEEKVSGPSAQEGRWKLLQELISTPQTPSGLMRR